MVASEDHLRPTDDKIPTGGPESGVLRTVLVPCTVILLGRWNWWPSRLSRVGAQPGGSDGPGGPGSAGGLGGPGGEGTEQDTESAAPRAR